MSRPNSPPLAWHPDSRALWKAFRQACHSNLLRSLPPSLADETFDPLEDDPPMDPSWLHIEVAYEMTFQLLCCDMLVLTTDSASGKRTFGEGAITCFDKSFVRGLLVNFTAEDPRERNAVKRLLHRLYSRMTKMRSFVRQEIASQFGAFVYESQLHCGIGDLLEMLLGIIAGFTIPLKAEHRLFCEKALLPLHIPSDVTKYMSFLAPCVLQFVEKEPSIALSVVKLLGANWPNWCVKVLGTREHGEEGRSLTILHFE